MQHEFFYRFQSWDIGILLYEVQLNSIQNERVLLFSILI